MKQNRSALLIAAAAGLIGMGSAPSIQHIADQPQTKITQRVSKRQMLRQARGPMLYASGVTSRHTVAQDKRRSAKARNRAANRAAHR